MTIECEDKELLEEFITESAELLEKLDDDLVALERSPGDADLLNRVFRSIHTIKGASSFLGFEFLVTVTHRTEDVLNRLRKAELVVDAAIMDVILEAVDLIKVLVGDIKGGEIKERDLEKTLAKLKPLLEGEAAPSKPSPDVPPVEPAAETDSAVSAVPQEVSLPKKKPKKESKTVKPAAAKSKAKGAVAEGPDNAPADARHDELLDKSTVRVDVKRLDDLMNQMGELVLERNRMMQLSIDLQGEVNLSLFGEEFGKLSKRLDFVTSELQMQVLKMRMIPVGNIFRKFPRIVRNLARELEKEVDLQIVGEETELDRSVVDEIGDPLIHLIRNAMDHGIENPEEREAGEKPRRGTLVLSARHEGNQIVISIKDDGRGLDVNKIRKKAVEKGLVTEEQLQGMGEREIIDLIFLPGFSTKDKATDVSGRGVGMDVVRTNIKKLNGIIDIRTKPGEGSEFVLKLPLTLAIIQSLLVEVETETYSIPLSSVIETLRVAEKDFHTIGGHEVLKRHNSVLPILRLQDLFGIDGAGEGGRALRYVVVVGVAEKRLGLVVTRLLGQQEVAIKSLGRFLTDIPGIAGSTILGDGRVTLILDPAKLVEYHHGKSTVRLAA